MSGGCTSRSRRAPARPRRSRRRRSRRTGAWTRAAALVLPARSVQVPETDARRRRPGRSRSALVQVSTPDDASEPSDVEADTGGCTSRSSPAGRARPPAADGAVASYLNANDAARALVPRAIGTRPERDRGRVGPAVGNWGAAGVGPGDVAGGLRERDRERALNQPFAFGRPVCRRDRGRRRRVVLERRRRWRARIAGHVGAAAWTETRRGVRPGVERRRTVHASGPESRLPPGRTRPSAAPVYQPFRPGPARRSGRARRGRVVLQRHGRRRARVSGQVGACARDHTRRPVRSGVGRARSTKRRRTTRPSPSR